jgi:hypothetical protein
MIPINTSKVLIGGIVASVVIFAGQMLNHMMFEERWNEATQGAGLTSEFDTLALTIMTLFLVGLGLVTAWLYAGLRTRFGAGPATAIKAGTAVWACWSVFGYSTTYFIGLYPGDLVAYSVIISFVFINAGALIAGKMYTEVSAVPAQA